MNKTSATIVKKLGMQAFALLGASRIRESKEGIAFRIGPNPKRVAWVRITYNPGGDSFGVSTEDKSSKPLSGLSGIYADELCHALEEATGLAVTFKKIPYRSAKKAKP